MELSRQTKDRLIAAGSVALIIALAFAIVLIVKSTALCRVTFYVGDDVVQTQKVKKGDRATYFVPENLPQGKTFECWVTEDGTTYNFSSEVDSDVKLVARLN